MLGNERKIDFKNSSLIECDGCMAPFLSIVKMGDVTSDGVKALPNPN